MSEKRGCLGGWLSNLFGGQADSPAASIPRIAKVMISTKFVTKPEAEFFRLLREVVGPRGHVLAQVSLKQLLFFPNSSDRSLRQTWVNKTCQKSVDFLICDPQKLQPLVAIELDEASHATPDRQTRDDDVEAILRAAGLPLVHVLTSPTYETRELEEWIGPHLPRRADRRGH